MSTYTKMTKSPKTGKWEEALWLDDHFGPHQYGVKFPNDLIKDIVNPDKVKLETRDYTTEEQLEQMKANAVNDQELYEDLRSELLSAYIKLNRIHAAWVELHAAHKAVYNKEITEK